MSHFDLLVRGADIADGTGRPLIAGQVAVTGGRVRVLPPRAPATADRILDVPGHVVAPGFIDAHTHSDLTTLDGSGTLPAHAAVLQGVTVEICGNCGDSAFPAPYPDFAAFGRAHAAAGRANHLAALVGHGTLRGAVVGHAARAATPDELAAMCRVLDEALASGAAGLSTGLIYTPGSFADTAEVTALAAVAARHGKPYVTHLRDEMSQVEAALDEAVRIARDSGAALHVSHHKTAGRHGWGGTERTLPHLRRLRADGMDVTCDVYPYTAGSTALAAMLPPWAHDGGQDRLLERLRDPGQRARMRAAIADGVAGWENTVGNGGWDRISVAGAARRPGTPGADDRGHRRRARCRRRRRGGRTAAGRSGRRDDHQPLDAGGRRPAGARRAVLDDRLGRGAQAGAAASALGRDVREGPRALRTRVGPADAARGGAQDDRRHRGPVRPGRTGRAARRRPRRPGRLRSGGGRRPCHLRRTLLAPSGVRLVVVAGAVVVEDGEMTSARPGQVLAC